jgi:hypothetical protein
MNIALLLYGQMRTFDHPKVLEKLNNFIEKYNCDVFISTWNNRGISIYSPIGGESRLNISNSILVEEDFKKIKNVKGLEIESYESFLNNITDDSIKNLLNENDSQKYLSKITSYPQFYKRYKANELKNKYKNTTNINYDVVIISRPDFLYVHNDIQEHLNNLNNTLYHINTGISYYPNRVYDVFTFSKESIMDIMCSIWLEYKELAQLNTNCALPFYDACRLLYSQCIKHNIEIKSTSKVLGDVLRPENYSDYQSFENIFL